MLSIFSFLGTYLRFSTSLFNIITTKSRVLDFVFHLLPAWSFVWTVLMVKDIQTRDRGFLGGLLVFKGIVLFYTGAGTV